MKLPRSVLILVSLLMLIASGPDSHLVSAGSQESKINVDYVSAGGNDSVFLTRLNLFAEQYRDETLYLTWVKIEGVEKDEGVFCLAVGDSGTHISPILKRDGITFATSANIASQLLGACSSNCDVNLGFRIEHLRSYWVAVVFEVGIRNIDVSRVVTDDPDTSIIAAGKRGDKYSTKALLKLGININAVDIHGKTALMYAAENAHSGTLKTILEAKPELNLRSKEGKTAMGYARQAGKKDIVSILQKARASE